LPATPGRDHAGRASGDAGAKQVPKAGRPDATGCTPHNPKRNPAML